MIKIPIDRVFWSQNVDAGPGLFGKSLTAGGPYSCTLTYLGHGVLIERPGQQDRLVPIGNVLHVEASEKLTAEEWGGEDAPAHVGHSDAPKRGPGRPRKGE